MTELGSEQGYAPVEWVAAEVPSPTVPSAEPVEVAAAPTLTVSDVVDSLTGFDEVAIKIAYKGDLSSLDPTTLTRALKFVLLRRAGVDDRSAFGQVMAMTLAQVKASFLDEPDEDDDEVEDSSGKA